MMEPIILLDERLNELAQRVSRQLYDGYYFNQGKIKGEELKSFSAHQQINKFLLFQVFQAWELQMQKIKHPYFNFEDEEVQQSVKLLQNQLSKHIEIREADFKPLLERAVFNNLKLLLDPVETFSKFFFVQSDSISIEVYNRYAQFFSDLNFIVNSISGYCKKHGLEEVQQQFFLEKMEKTVSIFERKSGKSFHQHRVALFEKLTGHNLDTLISEMEQAAKQREAEIARQEAERQQKIEEEKRRQEEEARRKEEEARRQEEAQRAEEEARRQQALEAQRKAEEEARQRAEEEARLKAEKERKRNFFDNISAESEDLGFDLDLDELDTEEPENTATPVAEPPKPEPVETPAEAPVVTPPVVQVEPEPTPEPEPAPTPEPEAPVVQVEEVIEDEKEAEFLEMAASMEPVDEAETPEEPAPEKPKTFFDQISNGVAKETPATPIQPAQERSSSVLDQIQDRKQTIAEKLAENKQSESKASGGKIKLDEIPIHKQYQYVQKVFEGNNVRFRIIVDKINNAGNAAEVQDILEKFVLSNVNLDQDDPIVGEFIELLRARFV
ncbi:hypothetical protein [Pontibacter sp. G13]|uniref:hypothetical protein n=1 Tax=Pontibacter sp. G13 TaxID=3074898 RepID=UPI00288A6A11|nr:hypothetical protein [Pontibacter sp. G13]WNJ16684.1 hypothetical protein RJD25_17600 [Pontibacter sp. G13]